MKKVQLSNSDFKKFIKENYYYVDKTLLIEELLNKESNVILLPRPRRFGKTLNLSMLKYYFDIRENNKDLFNGLKIEKSDIFEKHINKYPTIYLTLKEVKGLSWDKIYGDFKFAISNLYKEHKYLLNSNKLDIYDKELINKIIKGEAPVQYYENSLKILSEYMYKHYDKEVVILLDEYDTVMNSFYDKDTYNNITSFLRVFIGSAFKDNRYLFKGVITGILRIAKESIFSGANNIVVYTILDNNFSDKFGFTEDEVLHTLKYFKLEDKIDDVKSWYDGYTFGNKIIYNPYSIVNYVDNKEFKSYWVNTSNNLLIKDLLINSDFSVKEKLEELIKGNNIEEEIEESVVLNQLNNNKYLWSLLLFSGYLKIVNKTDNDNTFYRLAIVNREVKSLYIKIIEEYFNERIRRAFKIVEAIVKEDIEAFKNLFIQEVEESLSYYDIGKEVENTYHVFVLGMLIYLKDKYEVKSNKESGHGRYDICLIPNDKNKLGYIIEFKKAKNKSIKESANEAINQIESKGYATELKSKGIKNIVALGIAFKNKKVHIINKKV